MVHAAPRPGVLLWSLFIASRHRQYGVIKDEMGSPCRLHVYKILGGTSEVVLIFGRHKQRKDYNFEMNTAENVNGTKLMFHMSEDACSKFGPRPHIVRDSAGIMP